MAEQVMQGLNTSGRRRVLRSALDIAIVDCEKRLSSRLAYVEQRAECIAQLDSQKCQAELARHREAKP
jgi:hypothetical protein